MDVDVNTVALGVLVMLTRADAVIGIGDRLWRRVRSLKQADLERAHRLVEEQEEREALAQLAQLHEPLVALVQSVGSNGKPLHDRLTDFAGELREVLGDVGEIRQRLERGDERMGRIEEHIGMERRSA